MIQNVQRQLLDIKVSEICWSFSGTLKRVNVSAYLLWKIKLCRYSVKAPQDEPNPNLKYSLIHSIASHLHLTEMFKIMNYL